MEGIIFRPKISCMKSIVTFLTKVGMVLLLGATAFVVQAQVSGTITDEEGEALIGANVLIKGSTIGTVADLDGSYTLDADDDDILVVSYTGYASQEIPVDGRSMIDIILFVDAAQLSEVVVTGYGSQTKANLTGSVGVVAARELEARPITSASQSLPP